MTVVDNKSKYIEKLENRLQAQEQVNQEQKKKIEEMIDKSKESK